MQWFDDVIATPLRQAATSLSDAIAASPLKGLISAEMLHEQAVEQATADYAAHDGDGDHRLDFDEFCAAVRASEEKGAARLTKEQLRKRFLEIDEDGSGFIDMDEYVRQAEARKLETAIAQERKRQARYIAARRALKVSVPPAKFNSEREYARRGSNAGVCIRSRELPLLVSHESTIRALACPRAKSFFSAPRGSAKMNLASRPAFGFRSGRSWTGMGSPSVALPNNAALALSRSASRASNLSSQVSSGRGNMGTIPGRTRV